MTQKSSFVTPSVSRPHPRGDLSSCSKGHQGKGQVHHASALDREPQVLFSDRLEIPPHGEGRRRNRAEASAAHRVDGNPSLAQRPNDSDVGHPPGSPASQDESHPLVYGASDDPGRVGVSSLADVKEGVRFEHVDEPACGGGEFPVRFVCQNEIEGRPPAGIPGLVQFDDWSEIGGGLRVHQKKDAVRLARTSRCPVSIAHHSIIDDEVMAGLQAVQPIGHFREGLAARPLPFLKTGPGIFKADPLGRSEPLNLFDDGVGHLPRLLGLQRKQGQCRDRGTLHGGSHHPREYSTAKAEDQAGVVLHEGLQIRSGEAPYDAVPDGIDGCRTLNVSEDPHLTYDVPRSEFRQDLRRIPAVGSQPPSLHDE